MSEPSRPVLLYDGDCGFCSTSAEWVRRMRAFPTDFAVTPYQRADLVALGLTIEQCDEALQWVDDTGVYAAQDAVAGALRHCRRWLRPLGSLLRIPLLRALAGVIYRWVARNRYRLPGGTPSCRSTPSE